MKTFDPDGRLAVTRAAPITIIARPRQPVTGDAWRVPGTSVVLLGGEQVREDLAAWLAEQEIDEAARALGVSRAVAGRMRIGLGIAKSYDRQSRTTAWRKTKENDVSE